MIFCTIFFWIFIVSALTMASLIFNVSNISNTELFSFFLSSELACANTSPLDLLQAVMLCRAFLCSSSNECLYVFPSIAICSFPLARLTSLTPLIKAWLNCSAEIALTMRTIVSSTGPPCLKGLCSRSQSNLSWPKPSISCHPSAPEITALTVRNRIPKKSYLTLISLRGSSIIEKCR